MSLAFTASLAAGCKSKDAPAAPELTQPAKLTLVSGDGQTTTAPGGTPLAPLVVRVADPKDRPISRVTVAWAASDPSAKLSATTSTTDAQGQAQVTWTLAEANGVQSVTATTTTIPGARVVFQAKITVSSISGTVAVGRAPPLAFSANRTPSPSAASVGSTRDEASLARALAAPHRLIVQFKPTLVGASRAFAIAKSEITRNHSAMQQTLATYVARSIVTRAEVSPAILAARVTVPDGADVRSTIATLSSDPAVESVTVDEIMPMLGDYTATEVSPMPASPDAAIGSTPPSAAAITLSNDPVLLPEYWHYNLVDAFRVWGTNTGSAQVLVAVVDQGVRFDHPGMASNFTTDGYNFVAAGDRLTAALPICASSGGGTSALTELGPSPDPTLPDDFAGISSAGCLVRQSAGDHGLHVSGTIGAPGNDGVGTAGLNWKVQIRPVRVLDVTGFGSYFDIAQGILYAAGLPAAGAAGAMVQASPGARVINMSLGGTAESSVLRAAVTAATAAGSLIVASAGNSSTYLPSYPASYPEVLSVAALGPDLQLTGYTNVGPNISLAAPGGDFRYCCAGGGVVSTTYNFISHTGNYASYSGTSMAAPHVTGIAALVLATNPSMTNTQLRQRLQSTAVDVGPPGRDDRYGYGIVNAYNAVNNITSPPRNPFVRIINASTGDVFRSLPVASGSYSVSSVPAGSYYVVAGEDDSNDQTIGIPGRRLGWFGGAAPAAITVAAGQAANAPVVVGSPFASKPNGTFASATRLFVNTYAIDFTTSADPVAWYVVQIPKAAAYFFETTGVLGACGNAMELDTFLELYDQTQVLKASNNDAIFPGSVRCSQIATTLTPGTYYLRVTGSGVAATTGGQFRISVRDAP
jgi:subtilisin family serine protease